MMADDQPLGDRLLKMLGGFRVTLPQLPKFTLGQLPQNVSLRRLALLLVVGGVASIGIIGVLNAAAQAQSSDGRSLALPLLFVLLILIYRFAQRSLIRTASSAIEESLQLMRSRIAGKLVRLDLDVFESLPRESMLASLGQHYAAISDAILPMALGVQSSAILVLTVAYLIYLSPIAGIMTAALGLACAAIYIRHETELAATMRVTADERMKLLAMLREVTDGFKELRLDAVKRQAVMEEVVNHSRLAAGAMAETASIHGRLMVFATSVAYVLAAACVLVLPVIDNVDQKHRFVILTVVLFFIGPLGGAVGSVQHFTTARFALQQIRDFERRLDQLITDIPPAAPPVPFQSLQLREAAYQYTRTDSETPFNIGPLDFNLHQGEIIFITGANGSGKTTLLRLLTGLYRPRSGEIELNGATVTYSEYESYRQNFSTVLSDFHVFRCPYGFSDDQLEVLDRTLQSLQIRHKLPQDLRTGYDPSRLSTGQRKRLALAVAVSEGRPVLVIDEWAADQDPESRETFYRAVLPQLQKEGVTIVAVTHDDRYFDAANRRYHMEEGRLSLDAE